MEKITYDKIIKALKYITEHQSLSYDELVKGLEEMDWNYTMEDINEQYPPTQNLFEDFYNGDLAAIARIISLSKSNEDNRMYSQKLFLDNDGPKSMYNVIRLLTGDETYTIERIKNQNNTKKPGIQITLDETIKAAKYIAEHQSLPYDEFVKGLEEIGWNYTIDDVEKQFQFPEDYKIMKKLNQGDYRAAASIIANAKSDEGGRELCREKFLSNDDPYSLYHFIRQVTEDETYTMDKVVEQRKHK